MYMNRRCVVAGEVLFLVVGEVLFNSCIPDEPPDFIFGDPNFLPDIDNIQVRGSTPSPT